MHRFSLVAPAVSLHFLQVYQVCALIPLIFVERAQHEHEVELEGIIDQRAEYDPHDDYEANVVRTLVNSLELDILAQIRVCLVLFTEVYDDVVDDEVDDDDCDQFDEVENEDEGVGEPEAATYILVELLAERDEEDYKK